MRFNHATLIVSDFQRSKRFYRALGLIQIVDAPPRYARFSFPSGDATFSIEVTGEAIPAKCAAQVYFECDARDTLDAKVTELKAQGFVFTQDPTDMEYLWREARLRDPDGHDIRLYFAGRNRLDPPWKIQAR